MNYYPLLTALGLLFLAASFLVTHRTGRTALVVLSCVAFLVAAILTVVGTAGVPGG
jgi:Na+/H+-dicarboxylate symporter